MKEKRKKKKKNNNNREANKDRKEPGRTEAIVKGSELNDFAVHLS